MKMVSTVIHVNVWLDLMERIVRIVSTLALRASCCVYVYLKRHRLTEIKFPKKSKVKVVNDIYRLAMFLFNLFKLRCVLISFLLYFITLISLI